MLAAAQRCVLLQRASVRFMSLPKKRPHATAFQASRQGWDNALWAYCSEPEKHSDDVVYYDDRMVIIRDKYAKSQHHYLAMPRQKLDGIKQLTREHLPLLDALYEKCVSFRDEVITRDSVSMPFRIGFHAVPSMRQLHIHVISQDFKSDALKNKKHWNSFTTAFFKDFQEVRQLLEDTGRVDYDQDHYEAMLKQDMRCFVCTTHLKNIPEVKRHISERSHLARLVQRAQAAAVPASAGGEAGSTQQQGRAANDAASPEGTP